MTDLSFLAFCITVIALTAISQGKDKVTEKALSALNHTVEDFASILEKILVSFISRKLLRSSKNPNQSLIKNEGD